MSQFNTGSPLVKWFSTYCPRIIGLPLEYAWAQPKPSNLIENIETIFKWYCKCVNEICHPNYKSTFSVSFNKIQINFSAQIMIYEKYVPGAETKGIYQKGSSYLIVTIRRGEFISQIVISAMLGKLH